jgi:hypothetical protein
VWGKILLVLLLGMALVGFVAVKKPSEADSGRRSATRKELQARG